MSSSHPSAAVDDGNSLRHLAEDVRQKYREMQSSNDESGENEGYGTNSIGYNDKSTQTESVAVGHPVGQSSDSLPELPNYEISQIISDVIDKLPPGSLLPLEESMFAPGSKRNLEYQAELKAKKASQRMSSNGKAEVSGSNDSQCSREANKPDQTEFAFSNRFSTLAGYKQPEQVSQITSKSLIGPGLYARAGKVIPKKSDEAVKGQIHTYSPAPGLVLKYESVEWPSPSRFSPKAAEKPRITSFNHPPTLHDSTETKDSSPKTNLPPHLRAGQSSDPVKKEKASVIEPIQLGSSKPSYPNSLTMRDIPLHDTSAIKPIKIKEEDNSSSLSPTMLAVQSGALEGKGPSPHLIKENQPVKSSSTTEHLPPHLRNSEHQNLQQGLNNPIAKSNESISAPWSSTEKWAPNENGESPVSQHIHPDFDTAAKFNASTTSLFSSPDRLTSHETSKGPAHQNILPVANTGAKPYESSISPVSNTEILAPHRKGKMSTSQQILPLVNADHKQKGSKPSSFSSTDKLPTQENSKAVDAQDVIPVIDGIKTELNESTSSLFASIDKIPPHMKGKILVSEQVINTHTKLKESTLSPFSDTKQAVSRVESESPAVVQIVPAIEPKAKQNVSNTWSSSSTFGAGSAHSRTLGASTSDDVGPDLKDALYFKAWPKSEPRDTPGSFSFILTGLLIDADVIEAAEIRRIIITKLPFNATPSFVTSIVSGGPLERLDVKGSTAHVLFLHAKDCQKFYDDTGNGLDYTFEGRKGIAHVDKATDVDVVSGQARTFIELGFTRCVRATGIGSDFTVERLKEKAGYKNRMVDDVVVGASESGVSINFLQFPDNLY